MYQKLTFKAIKELAAPQTWPASILPVLIAGALSFTLFGTFPVGIFVLLLFISIALQCAVNTLNDYFDFVKGTDTAQNSIDESDASIIYNHLQPRTALAVGFAFLAGALLGGLYLVFCFGWPLLLIGLLGALAIYFYSGGPYPISYMPIGELVSGMMMGGFLPMAALYALSGHLLWSSFYYTSPLVISIGLILLTNNTCDIERDIPAGRRTLPILIGKKAAGKLLFCGFALVLAVIAHLAYWEFRYGFLLVIVLLVHSYPRLKALWRMEFDAINRRNAMQNTLKLTIMTNTYYLLIILAEGLLHG